MKRFWIPMLLLLLALPQSPSAEENAGPSGFGRSSPSGQGGMKVSGPNVTLEKTGGFLFRFRVPVELTSLPGSPEAVHLFCLVRGGGPKKSIAEADGGPSGGSSSPAGGTPLSIGMASAELAVENGEYKGPSPVTLEIREMVKGNPAAAEFWACLVSPDGEVDPENLSATAQDAYAVVTGNIPTRISLP